MGSINAGRVVVGGLLAGVVINALEFLMYGVLMAETMSQFYQRFNLPMPGGGAMTVFVVLGFLGGIVMIWTYAAIRPRFGPGPRTAVFAGLVAWFFAYLWPTIGFTMMGLFTWGVALVALLWGLLEFAVAAIAGAWLYHEGATAPAAASQF